MGKIASWPNERVPLCCLRPAIDLISKEMFLLLRYRVWEMEKKLLSNVQDVKGHKENPQLTT